MNIFRRFIKAKIEQVKDWQDPNREESPMQCPEIVITDVDKDLHEKLYGDAVAAGVQFDGNQATLHGIQLSWNWDEVSSTLVITALKKPFYASCEAIENKIRQLVAQAAKGEL